MSKLLIWGAGGHAKVVLDIARATGRYEDIALLDDARSAGSDFCGYPVVGGAEALPSVLAEGFGAVVIAIGDNATRARCYLRALELGFSAPALVHPSSVLSPSAEVGPGSVVMPLSVLNAYARVAANVIINTGAIIEHDCEVGNHAHISPRALLAGGCKVREYAHVGAGAIVLPGITVGARAVVGAGAVVVDDVSEDATVVGVPARALVARP